MISTTQDREIRQTNLIRISGPRGGEPEVISHDRRLADLKLKVAAVVNLGPLQLAVGADEDVTDIVCAGDGDVLAERGGAGDGGAGEFDADGAGACFRVVGLIVEPDEVADPVGVRVARQHDVVADVVRVQRLEGPVAVSLVAVPGVVVQRVLVAESDGEVEAREDGLAADDAPGGLALGGPDKLVVEPIFLSAAHHRPAGVIGDVVDVVGVPVKVGD